jgi:hypothetical protein
MASVQEDLGRVLLLRICAPEPIVPRVVWKVACADEGLIERQQLHATLKMSCSFLYKLVEVCRRNMDPPQNPFKYIAAPDQKRIYAVSDMARPDREVRVEVSLMHVPCPQQASLCVWEESSVEPLLGAP